MPADSARRQQIEQLYQRLREQAPECRNAFLDQTCAGDEVLRHELEALVAEHARLGVAEVRAADNAECGVAPDPAARSFLNMSGRTLSHFLVKEEIDTGGMGTVYRARDEHLQRDVALKILKPGRLGDASAHRRFKREALSLASVNHPNIAGVIDFDTQDGIDFLVMEYIPGITLTDKLSEGRLPEKEILRLGMQLAEGLAAAHAQGVVHHDLKPGNLKVTPDGTLKILDFGLATLKRARGPQETTANLGDSVSAWGTLPYMSPEQVLGEKVDHRSDIYAVGTILYELSTCRLPYRATSVATLLNMIANKVPDPPRQIRPDLSPRLEDVILKCLEKDPENRYQSARELLIDLRRQSMPSAPILSPEIKPDRLADLMRTFRTMTGNSRLLRIIPVLILLVVVAAPPAWLYRNEIRHWLGLTVRLPKQKNLAVLPFRVIPDNADSNLMAAGLHETLTAQLTQLSTSNALQVLPSSEVRRGKITSFVDARRELGANLVLDGSLQFFEGSIRATMSLADTVSGQPVRAEIVSGLQSDPFALQNSVVDAVVKMLGVQLAAGQRERLLSAGTNTDADVLYVQAMGYLYGYRDKSVEHAIRLFQSVISRAPKFADAHAGLGQAYWSKYEGERDPAMARMAGNECNSAVELNSKSVPAHLCLGTIRAGTGMYGEAVILFNSALAIDPYCEAAYRGLARIYERLNRNSEAEAAYLKAIQLRQDWASYQWLGRFYQNQARYEDAAAQYRRAADLTPDNHRPLLGLGNACYFLGNYDGAIDAFRKANAICPTAEGYQNLGNAYLGKRQYADAISSLEQARRVNNSSYIVAGNLAKAYFWSPGGRPKGIATFREAIRLGEQELQINSRNSDAHILLARYYAMVEQKDDALAHLKTALELMPDDPEYALIAAVVCNRLGDRAGALDWLQKSKSGRYSTAEIRDDPDLSDLRDDPRFQQLIK